MECLAALEGVGDASLGEWEERGETAYHVRRRLTPEEQAPIGDACDIRGSAEGQERLSRLWRYLHPAVRVFASEEIVSAARAETGRRR